MLNKKAKILEKNVVFVIFAIVTIGFWIFLLYVSADYASAENVAKQIVLMIDSSKPETKIVMNAEELVEMAEEKKIARESVIRIEGNQVVVKLSDKNEGKYSFFTRAEVKTYFEGNNLVIEVK